MFVDVADQRELTLYRGDVLRGAPGLTLLGAALLPALGVGAGLLVWSFARSRKQKLVVSHDEIWCRGGMISAKTVCCNRRDITLIDLHQSWLQKWLGSGDLVIHARTLSRPIKMRGIAHVTALYWRLGRHLRPQADVRISPAVTALPAPEIEAWIAPALQLRA